MDKYVHVLQYVTQQNTYLTALLNSEGKELVCLIFPPLFYTCFMNQPDHNMLSDATILSRLCSPCDTFVKHKETLSTVHDTQGTDLESQTGRFYLSDKVIEREYCHFLCKYECVWKLTFTYLYSHLVLKIL